LQNHLEIYTISHMNASSTMFFTKTTSILVRSSGGTFTWPYIINEGSHFKYLGRQKYYRNNFTHC